jgi:hemerythrin-like domain-containing protein
MDATDILIEEHRVIERALSAMETYAARPLAGGAVQPGFFHNAAAFFRNYADCCHQRKEEEPFLQAMMEAGLSNQTGPLAIMLAEHEQARSRNRAMENAALALERGDSTAGAALLRTVRDTVAFLRSHIRRENEFLFPMSERLIPPPAQERLLGEFLRFAREETGGTACRGYHRLVEAMEMEAAA